MSNIVIWDRSFLADTGASLVDSNGGASKAGYAARISAANANSGMEPFVNLGDTTHEVLGALQEVNLDGRVVSVRLLGESFVVIGASVVAGNPLKVDANGRFIPASSGDKCYALALESNTLPATPTGNETVNALLRGPFVAR